jgi:hypothetical protein
VNAEEAIFHLPICVAEHLSSLKWIRTEVCHEFTSEIKKQN